MNPGLFCTFVPFKEKKLKNPLIELTVTKFRGMPKKKVEKESKKGPKVDVPEVEKLGPEQIAFNVQVTLCFFILVLAST